MIGLNKAIGRNDKGRTSIHPSVYRASIPCLSLWERWTSAASARRGDVPGKNLPLPLGEVAERSECLKGRSTRENILPLPLGKVAERSEDGEGNQ